MLRILLASAAMLCCVPCDAQQPGRRISVDDVFPILEDLEGVVVRLRAPALSVESRKTLADTIGSKLTDAGIKLAVPGQETAELFVTADISGQNIFMVRCALREKVYLDRDNPRVRTLATTWEQAPMFGTVPQDDDSVFRGALLVGVESFIADWKAANESN